MSTPDEAAVVCIRVPRVTTAALRPDAVVVHGLFRRRTVAWRDVADVRLETRGVCSCGPMGDASAWDTRVPASYRRSVCAG